MLRCIFSNACISPDLFKTVVLTVEATIRSNPNFNNTDTMIETLLQNPLLPLLLLESLDTKLVNAIRALQNRALPFLIVNLKLEDGKAITEEQIRIFFDMIYSSKSKLSYSAYQNFGAWLVAHYPQYLDTWLECAKYSFVRGDNCDAILLACHWWYEKWSKERNHEK
jgi:hypothetical protein